MEQQVHTLSALSRYIATIFKREFATQRFWVTGEIIGLKVSRGHCYLQLAEKDEVATTPKAEFRAIVWASAFEALQLRFVKETGLQLQEQLQVLCLVEVQFHERFGLSLIVHDIDPAFTLGKLEQERRKTIDRLKKEGLYHLNKQHVLPTVIQRIALISAEDSRGYEDFMTSLVDNGYGYTFYVKLFPSLLQGDLAASNMIGQLVGIFEEQGTSHFDAVVIVRGGGAASSLGCFNDYHLSRAIARFPLPVITGIGHSADTSVVDEVANINLITPTEAGVFLVNRMMNFEVVVSNYWKQLADIANQMIFEESSFLKSSMLNVQQKVAFYLKDENFQLKHHQEVIKNIFIQQMLAENNFLGNANAGLKAQLKYILQRETQFLNGAFLNIKNGVKNKIEREESWIQFKTQQLILLDPINILKRGFSYTLNNGKLLTNYEDVKSGDELTTILANGKIKSKVE
jgi:exodeoxyribonuclease VII large subunit